MPIRTLPRFREQYRRLPKPVQIKTDKALRLLDKDFRHPGLRSHAVHGNHKIFEAYVDEKYRITFER
jgi:hypothetical protein